jgi:phospholipid transport system substrate-binding protein
MRIHRVWLASILTVLFGAFTLANAAEESTSGTTAKAPEQIVNETVAKVQKVLQDPGYNDPAKKKMMREKVRAIILSVGDMKSVCILTLADYRKKFSDEQFEKFKDLFSRLLFTTYISHLEKNPYGKVIIQRTEKPSETRLRVKTKTVTDAGETPVDFSFVKLGKNWMLYDIHIEGVSMLGNYRTQFREILMKKSPDQFLEQLRGKVKENEENL